MTTGRVVGHDDPVQATATYRDGDSTTSRAVLRPRVRSADLLLALLVICVAIGLVLPCLGSAGLAAWRDGWAWWVQPVVAASAFGTPAILLLRRDPESSLGRWLAFVAVLAATTGAVSAWAWLALVGRPGSLPGGDATLWVASWLWFPGYFLLPTVLLMLAPDGRLPSPRWRTPRWFALAAIVLSTIEIGVSPYPTSGDLVIPQQPPELVNPLHSTVLHDA